MAMRQSSGRRSTPTRTCGAAWRAGRYDEPVTELIAMVDGKPVDVDGSFHAQITSVEQTGDAASVTLAEEGFWGTVSFVDFFSLARIDGTWKIVNKTFVPHRRGAARDRVDRAQLRSAVELKASAGTSGGWPTMTTSKMQEQSGAQAAKSATSGTFAPFAAG
jgi:hypothetical protein